MLSACASRKPDSDIIETVHNAEGCTIDGHNHAGEVLAGTKAAAEDAAREAAWHARERERNKERTQPSQPRTAQPREGRTDDGKDEKQEPAQPRRPPPR